MQMCEKRSRLQGESHTAYEDAFRTLNLAPRSGWVGKSKLSPFPWLTSSHNAARNNDSRMCLQKQASKVRDQYVMGKLYERRKSNHENHEKGKNCFRDKGTRKQNAETPKLTFLSFRSKEVFALRGLW